MTTAQVFKMEWKRALRSKGFWVALLLGCTLILMDSYNRWYNYTILPSYYASIGVYLNTGYNPVSVLTKWFGFNYDWKETVFYFMFPLLAVLPHASSYYRDKKSGYCKNILVHTTKTRYLRAKYLSVFLSGGVVVLFPLVLSLFLASLYMPFRETDVLSGAMGSQITPFVVLFFRNGYLYDLLIFFITFVTAGLMATLSLVASAFIENYFTTLVAPFAIAVLLYNLFVPLEWYGLVPFYFLWPEEAAGAREVHIALFLVVFSVVSVGGFLIKEEKKEWIL